MLPNVNELNTTYKGAKIKDNSTEVIYSTKPVKFNNNPYTTTVTTNIIRPIKENDAIDVTYSTKSGEFNNNSHTTMRTTKVLKSDDNFAYPSYKYSSNDSEDLAVDITYSSKY